MKKLIAMILTLAMVMSLCVAPASAAGSGVAITITPDKESVDTATGDAVVTYTVKAKVTDTTLKVGALTITLDPSAGLTLAEKMEKDDSAFFYQTTSKQYKYDEEAGTGIFDVKFSYAPKTKTFVAAGATNDRNLNSTHGEVVLMTIMSKIAKGTTGSVTLGTTTCTYGDVMAEASHNCDVTPTTVTILKAPITSVTASVTAPVAGQPLDFNGTVDASAPYSITKVEWFEGTGATGSALSKPTTAGAEQYYSVRITLTANPGETFAESLRTGDATTNGYSITRDGDGKLLLTRNYQTGSLPAATVTAKPTAKSGLKYNGSEHILLGFVGTANGGTMQYSLDNSSWSDAIPKGTNAGEYTVYYKAKGDGSTHSDSTVASISATIGPKSISSATIGTIADQPYTDGAITPDPVVTDGTTPLAKDTDYTVSCSHTYVGTNTGTFTITGKGNYTGTKSADFNIVAAEQNPRFTTPVNLAKGGQLDLSTLVDGAKGAVTFAIPPANPSATLSGNTLTATGVQGEVKVSVSITAKDVDGDGNNEYNAFSKSEAITVNVIDKTDASLTVTQADTTYGTALADPAYDEATDMIDSSLEVTYKGRGTTSYTENTAKPTDAGTYTVKVTYETATKILSGSADFTIEPKSISGATVTPSDTSLEYNGSAQTVTVTVKDGAYPLTKDTDYTVTSGNSGTDVNSYTVTVTGQGNYKDTAKATWKITPRDLIVTPNAGQSKKFGAEDPTLHSTNSGRVTGQIPDFSGALSRADGEAVGQYDITLGTLALIDHFSSGFKASNYTLKMVSPAVKFEITKADAPDLENITLSQKYNVTAEQSKDIGSAGMPEDAGNLTYTVGSASSTGGSASVTASVTGSTVKFTITGGTKGEIITLPVTIVSDNYENATVHVVITLTKPSYSGGTSYAITVEKAENGTVSADRGSASKGSTVTITVKPDKGYELDALKVLDKNGDKVKLTEKNGKYTFTMPAGKVTVKGSFVEETPVQIFKDVPVDAYYYEAVKWAAEKGITGGVGNGLFAPNQPCTRGQIVTFLWRAAGSPEAKAMSAFSDVADSAYYAKAVAWAVENGITGGTGNGKFSPDATCTRAQAVTFLYRASGASAVSGNAAFSDVATNAYYAAAVKWAEKNGVTGGIGGGLFGSGNDCTRAQIVTFLYRTYQGK